MQNQPKILFVDSEPSVLAGIRVGLRKERHAWDLRFAHDSAEALRIMEEEDRPVEVVISAIQLAPMDGVALFETARQRWPSMTRVILSGESDDQVTRRVLSLAHRFLAKPCEPERLKATLTQVLQVRTLQSDAALQVAAADFSALPPIPKILAEIEQIFKNPKSDGATLAAHISEDTALAAQVLATVNSSFFRAARPISSLSAAVSRLGFRLVRAIIEGTALFAVFPASLSHARTQLQHHASMVADLSRKLAATPHAADVATTSALLADIGTLVLMNATPDLFAEMTSLVERTGFSLAEAEQLYFGTTHAAVGAYAVGVWGLPEDIAKAIFSHHSVFSHCEAEISSQEVDLEDPAAVVGLATLLVDEVVGESGDENASQCLAEDTQSAEWKRLAIAIVQAEQDVA